ncbi:hypothetical protein AALP_AA4G148600 [Arabis alpina]|uniref:DUF4283 domain-containing protein n=1 Tax=Arabis alpina TaxID=50452 RepID=A0A087H3C5_ARAAL|nr:hypothetical protein AALP_AA4G148600 [Arabis alpina]
MEIESVAHVAHVAPDAETLLENPKNFIGGNQPAQCSGSEKQVDPSTDTDSPSMEPDIHAAATPTGIHTPRGTSTSIPTMSWAERARSLSDKSLTSVTTPTFSETGIPRVKVPDGVFHRGALAHKEFLVGYFFGKPPPVGLIQSVINHMWRKGKKVEIHVDYLAKSMLIRLPNDFIREKVLEKKYWHIDTCMFVVVPRASPPSSVSSELKSIPLWAHVTGIPFNMRTQEELCFVADALGLPRGTDDYTINLVSVNLSHLQIDADLSKPLPSSLELEREDGEVITCEVAYPWIPPACSLCKKLGHNIRYCPKANLKWVPVEKSKEKNDVIPPQPVTSLDKEKDLTSGTASAGCVTPSKVPVHSNSVSKNKMSEAVLSPIEITPQVPVKNTMSQSLSNSGTSSFSDSPMIIDLPPTILALPAHLHPTKKVLDFIASTQSPQLTTNQKTQAFTPSPSFESVNPFSALATTKKPVGNSSLFSNPPLSASSQTITSNVLTLPAKDAPLTQGVASPKH